MSLATLDILIIDDHAPMRALIRSLLTAVGVRGIREAADCVDAQQQLQTRPADLILIDHRLPGMTGLDFVRNLRANAAHPASYTRIVMMTGHGDRRHVTAARDAGVDEFLVKPITTATLLQRLEAAMVKGRTFIRSDTFAGPDRRRRLGTGPNGHNRRGGDLDLE